MHEHARFNKVDHLRRVEATSCSNCAVKSSSWWVYIVYARNTGIFDHSSCSGPKTDRMQELHVWERALRLVTRFYEKCLHDWCRMSWGPEAFPLTHTSWIHLIKNFMNSSIVVHVCDLKNAIFSTDISVLTFSISLDKICNYNLTILLIR